MMAFFIEPPREFDVSINNSLDHYFRSNKVIEVPGDLIIDVDGLIEHSMDIYVYGDLIVLGNLICHDIKVCGDIVGNGNIDCTEVLVGGAIIGPRINPNGFSLFTGRLLSVWLQHKEPKLMLWLFIFILIQIYLYIIHNIFLFVLLIRHGLLFLLFYHFLVPLLLLHFVL